MTWLSMSSHCSVDSSPSHVQEVMGSNPIGDFSFFVPHSCYIIFIFLFICAKDNKKYQFADFVMLVREKVDLEKYIATRQNKLNHFNVKWKGFFLRLYCITTILYIAPTVMYIYKVSVFTHV